MNGTLLVTGAASGIGAETARRAAAKGYRIALNYRSRAERAEAIAAGITAQGGRAVAIAADIARESDVVRLFDETERALGPVAGLVNSAGVDGGVSRVEDFDAAVLAELFSVNVVGLMLCCREAARRMSTRRGGAGGAIVNLSSMAATTGGRPAKSHYAASKGAIDSFTRGFAREVATEGIRVNAVRPGMILTEMTEAALGDPTVRADIESTIAMRRVGTAQEIAAAILWLLSDEASFVSGATLDASGGGFVFGKR